MEHIVKVDLSVAIVFCDNQVSLCVVLRLTILLFCCVPVWNSENPDLKLQCCMQI